MTTAYERVQGELRSSPRRWLITGVAGFIGSSLAEALLMLDQQVLGVDNFSTGSRENLESVREAVGSRRWDCFRFVEGDLCQADLCVELCRDVQVVLHQAALGSVPRSIADPLDTHRSNVTGFLNILTAAKDAGIGNFVFASSSSVYGDHPGSPKREGETGKPLSPYAATKAMNEFYAEVFHTTYGYRSIGLRYFNVFGPRQAPGGPYAAVMPNWYSSLLRGDPVYINGDGETSRDFCHIDNAVQANILAGCTDDEGAMGCVYNVACGRSTTLNVLFTMIRDEVASVLPAAARQEPIHRDFRPGDVRHSLADIRLISSRLGFEPTRQIDAGLAETSAWYIGLSRSAGAT